MSAYTNTLVYPDKLKEGDEVIFNHLGKYYKYKVHDNHLSGIGLSTAGSNHRIFDVLGIEDRHVYAGKFYISGSHSGAWPVTEHGDFEGLTKLVRAMFDKCDEGEGEEEEKEEEHPPTRIPRYSDGYKWHPVLQKHFHELAYVMDEQSMTMSNDVSDNNRVFHLLGLSNEFAARWAHHIYGVYPVKVEHGEDYWPKARSLADLGRFIEDIDRVSRIVLHEYGERITQEDPVPDQMEHWVFSNTSGKMETKQSTSNSSIINQNQISDGNIIKINRQAPQIVRGEERRGHSIQGRKCKVTVAVGYLSNKKVSG